MRIDACLKSRALTSPLRVTELKRRSVQEKTDLLRRIVSGIVNNAGMRIDSAAQRLSSLNPNGILRRGYAILNDADGKTVDSIKNVRIGPGTYDCTFRRSVKGCRNGYSACLK